MSQLARKNDKNSSSIPIISNLAKTVTANNLPVALVGSILQDGTAIITGSSTVTIENKPVAWINSKDTKSRVIIQGSNNITIGK